MPLVLRGRLEDILPAVKAQIVAWTGVPAGRVLIVARRSRDVPKLTAAQDILLRFRGFRMDRGNRGRHNRRVYHRLEVTVRTRFEMDAANQDARLLTDTSGGNIVAWEDVADALEEFYPMKGADLLVDEGLHLDGGQDSERLETGKGAGTGWCETTLVYNVPDILPLTQLPGGQP